MCEHSQSQLNAFLASTHPQIKGESIVVVIINKKLQFNPDMSPKFNGFH